MKSEINATKFKNLVILLCIQLMLGVNNESLAQQDIDLTSSEKGVEMVGEFTGALNFNVPIATVTSGSLSAPVNIAYVSNGLLPHSVSSSIGLGWTLNDIAVIYKNSRGMDDTWREYDGNLFCPGQPVVCDQSEYYDTALDDADIDGAYDIYTYNVMGYAGKFIVYPASNSCVQINKSDVVIERIDMWNFKVTLPNGNIVELYRTDYPNINDGFKNQAQTWQPQVIYSYDLKDTLKFKYDYTTYGFNALVDDVGITIAPTVPSYKQQNKYFPIQRLSKIIGKLDSVTLYYENRLDISSPTGLKCNKIKYESDNVCIENNLISDYFTDGPNGTGNATQLRLKEISRNKCGSSVDTLPRYKFDYYYYLNGDKFAPPKYTTGIDEWGYYNGAISNVQSNMLPNYLPDGVANRDVYTSNTLETVLKKITYPTGQTSLIEYEQNRFFKSIDAIQSIFNLYTSSTIVSPSVTIIADHITNGAVSMNLVPAGSTSYTSYLNLKIKNMQNAVLHTISFSNTQGAQVENYTIALKDIKDYANNQVLVVGTSYYFELTINNGSGNAIATFNPTNVEHLCGGLRVSKITNSNGNTSLDDVTNYLYENGVQYQAPAFSDYFASNLIYFNRLLKDENVMMDYNIGYGKVTISKPGNGKIVKLFKADFSKEYGAEAQRIVTDKLRQGVGSLLSSSVYDNNNILLTKDSFLYEVENLGIAGHNQEYFTEIGSGNYLGYRYQYNKYWFRPKKIINYYLGVETKNAETFYNHIHTIQPSSSRITTGNNEINEIYTDYTNNTWVDVNVKNYFIQKT
ncbi:MAG: hypothetical protein IPH94_09305 [Saprospiraceae bacterium]|nr:hypothetical protein [Saprospiraceae bacterium]